jgi:hypothetical protein
VKTLLSRSVAAIIVAGVLSNIASAGTPQKRKPAGKEQIQERLVFITGSLIPQRVRVEPIGTKTVSPLRVISRGEIDRGGRQTTAAALINDPSVRVISH